MFLLNEPRDHALIVEHQIMHAYWSAHARQVLAWLEDHPGNAAGAYDAKVYQARAAGSYHAIVAIRGW